VPISIALMPKLRNLGITKNPIKKPVIPASSGIDSVKELLLSSTKNHQCRIMMVGDPGVGKTSLVRSLYFSVTPTSKRTTITSDTSNKGLEISNLLVPFDSIFSKKYKLPASKVNQIEFSFWDYPGSVSAVSLSFTFY